MAITDYFVPKEDVEQVTYSFTAYPTASWGYHYLRIDDDPESPDTGTFVITYANGLEACETYWGDTPALPVGSTDITVSMFFRVSNELNTYLSYYTPRLKVNGTLYSGTQRGWGSTTWTSFTQDWTTNPDTSLAWTVADINGSGSNPIEEFGISIVPGSYYDPKLGWSYIKARCTSLYMYIEYTPPSDLPYAFVGGMGVIIGSKSISIG